ncbi:MAG TPA: DsbA family oxidoreductase [Streptosporangiaceae bacterium]|jgi:predicted DsbA family dithiol-disulfide isomerase|nr:DsbA family oxidoreductase [Streptosporangiaceae bacterium]
MRVDIWSDVVCPWCYLGRARFEKALAGFGGRDDVEVVYHSFELDPSWPQGQTMPILEMLATKYHLSPADAEAAEGQVAGLARAEGLPFRTDRPLGNTFDVHRVLHLGRDQGFQHRLLDAVYQAYFGEAADVFDPGTLGKIAATAGLDPEDVQHVLDGDDYTDDVRADEDQARQLGISGVPFFVLDGRLGVSGAQSTETFAEALRQAAG